MAELAVRVISRARRAGVPTRQATIVRGQTSRDKVVRVEGLTEAELRASLTTAR
jgi:uncharacterized protein YggU (UPF0235/DUF167 family)